MYTLLGTGSRPSSAELCGARVRRRRARAYGTVSWPPTLFRAHARTKSGSRRSNVILSRPASVAAVSFSNSTGDPRRASKVKRYSLKSVDADTATSTNRRTNLNSNGSIPKTIVWIRSSLYGTTAEVRSGEGEWSKTQEKNSNWYQR